MSNVFISYSHTDNEWKERLISQLRVLEIQGRLTIWADHKIGAGQDWYTEIQQAMGAATVAVLLVSSDYLTSKFVTEEEVPRLLERRRREGLRIFPVIVRSCLWDQVAWLAALDVRPNGPPKGRPLLDCTPNQWESELTEIAREVGEILAAVTSSEPPAMSQGRTDIEDSTPELVRPVAMTFVDTADAATSTPRPPRFLLQQVRDAIVESRRDLKVACEQIDVMSVYKDLHERLHTLQLACFNRIMDEARRIEADEIAWEALGEHEITLKDAIQGIRRFVERSRLIIAEEMPWIEELDRARLELHGAVEGNDRSPIVGVIRRINRVLSLQLPQLNTRLNEAARVLLRSSIEEALEGVRLALGTTGMDAQGLSLKGISLEAFANLNHDLGKLVSEHDQWQQLDSELRLIEDSLKRDVAELKDVWKDLRDKIDALNQSGTEEWRSVFQEVRDKLNGAIAAVDEPMIRRHFRNLRRRTSSRFFEVDADLKSVCSQLQKISGPLHMVLEVIA